MDQRSLGLDADLPQPGRPGRGVHLAVVGRGAAQLAAAKGMTPAQHADLRAVDVLAGKTNYLANTLQLPVDEPFDAMRG
jgi:hypothetical protein